MNVEYTGRHFTVTSKLRGLAEEHLAAIDKVTNRCNNAHVILAEDKYRKIAEITLMCRGESLVATAEASEMEQALLAALHKVEQQAIRHKEKFVTTREHPKPIAAEAEAAA
jgi:putative sigma-54 modulation protein